MPTSSYDRERRALVQWLGENQRQIVLEWVRAIQEDPEIPDADHLTLAALQDHFPEMVEELIEGLKDPKTLLDADTRQAAIDHGKRRWRHRYRLDELLRELTRVREILLAQIRRFCEEHRIVELREEVDAKVRKFFDMVVAHSAQQFMQEQTNEITLRSTQLKEAFQQVKAATEQLRAIAQSRFRMLRGVSHELRNALNEVSLGTANLLQEESLEERNAIMELVTRNAANLQKVLDRLQQFSNILGGDTQLHVELLEVGEFLKALEKTHGAAAMRKGLEFQRDEVANPPSVKTDHEKLRHIADILLLNAVEYTESGRVEVTTNSVEKDEWTLSVVDTGIGIPESDAKMVFREMHGRSRTAGHRPGLGLLIAQYLAHLMHGEITFESRRGEGSCFALKLPRDLSALAA